MASGIKDKVAILGMGCTRFGERWDMGAEELMVEAYEECLEDAGVEPKQIDAAWLGVCVEEISIGKSSLAMPMTLRLPYIPVTRVENFCATGTDAFRGAVYAVASGACDIALALGVEDGQVVFGLVSADLPDDVHALRHEIDDLGVDGVEFNALVL